MGNIKFSAQPGAYERHLQRKYCNPLFPQADRSLLQFEVDQARERDQQDLKVFLHAFEQTVQEMANLTASVETDELQNLKQQLEQLYIQSLGLAGDLSHHQTSLIKFINACMSGLHQGAKDDVNALTRLEQEGRARVAFFELIENKLVADILRGDELIHPSELTACILSEPLTSLPAVFDLFDREQQVHLLSLAEEFIAQLDDDVRQSTQVDARLVLLQQILDVT